MQSFILGLKTSDTHKASCHALVYLSNTNIRAQSHSKRVGILVHKGTAATDSLPSCNDAATTLKQRNLKNKQNEKKIW